MLINQIRTFLLFLLVLVTNSEQYEVPEAKVEVFYPQGFKVSIPDEKGVELFAFHGKINKEMNGREAGDFSVDITKAKEGRWTFFEPNAKLKVGDTLNYWTYVLHSTGGPKLGYPRDGQTFVVTELIGQPSEPEISTSPSVVHTSKPPRPTKPANKPIDPNCPQTITSVKNKKICAGQLILNEAFNKPRPNQWIPEVKFAGGPDYEFVLYDTLPHVLYVVDNKLRIVPVLTETVHGEGFCTKSEGLDLGPNCTGKAGTEECYQKPESYLILPPVISARISSKFVFRYGKVEIKAKLPKGDWIYPELYLNPKEEHYGPGYDSGQIRIAFLPGNEGFSNVLYGGCILGSSKAARHYGLRNIRKDVSWAGEFHKFWMTWTDERITVGVDDTTYGNIYPPEGGFSQESVNPNAHRWKQGTKMAPFDKMMYVTLGVGVGGHCFDDLKDGSKPWTNTDPKAQRNFYKAQSQWYPTWGPDSSLEVDYVKIWSI